MDLEVVKLGVSVVGLGGTLVAAIIAIRTFRRTEKWKRAEFLAREMKEFFEHWRVRNALLMIDWGVRRIQLLDPNAPDHGMVRVTRELQVHALLPHTLKNEGVGSDAEAEAEEACFSPPEAAIRDCYDTFLDGLERFSSYVQTGLVDVEQLRPYLQYWIDDVHSPAKDPDDAAWNAALLTYIDFYRFRGAQWLFRAFGRGIDPSTTEYTTFLREMTDQALAIRLAGSVGVTYPSPPIVSR